MKIEKQVQRMKKDIECHWQELSALNTLKASKEDAYLEAEIKKIKKLIAAKQDLIKTIALDYGIGN